MLMSFVLWGVVLSGLTGAVVLAYRAYQWNTPTRAVLTLSGAVLAACVLGYLWGSSASLFFRAASAVALALTGAVAAWSLANTVARLSWKEREDEAAAPPPVQREFIDRLRGITDAVHAAADRVAEAIAEVASERSAGILETSSMLEEMTESMKGIGENTERLSESAEESSSSILEMGATVEEVGGNMQTLGGSAEECVASIGQMATAIREVAGNVEGLSEVAEETNAAMEEMAATIKQVEGNAGECRQLSLEVVNAAEQGRARVSATISGIEAIRSASEDAQGVIISLGRRAQEIGDILDVIDEVAEETKLLALNAAIIAAQAGEHGRGFSVVADQIKDLADRVGASTKEIDTLIKAVQDESENAVGAVQEGAQMVAEGVRLSNEAGDALERITERAQRSGEMIGEIARATSEQTKGAGAVADAMERMRDMVGGIRNSMEEQTRGSELVMNASGSMRDLAQQVKGMVQEQDGASRRITLNIEDIREMVQRINRAVQDQRGGLAQAAMAMGSLPGEDGGSPGALETLTQGVSELQNEVKRLSAEIENSGT